MTYAVLYNPGHNRVYFETSVKLSLSEFCIAAQRFNTKFDNLRNRNICGVDYLAFDTEKELTGTDVKILSGLSFVYALFVLEGAEPCLRLVPIARSCENYVDDSIVTILKYTGKTNEIFTRMMVNIAYSSRMCGGGNENINLLDPLAGKGTTLYEGLIKGYNVYGIEIGDKAASEAYHYLQRFLETAKYKFSFNSVKISGPGRSFSAARHTFIIARTKQELKDNDIRTAEFIAGDSQYARSYYKKNFFDMIVGDLPYGIQHGNVTNENQSSLTRNPAELLNACFPAWREVLRPGGCIVLAWNSNVLERRKMIEIFEGGGFSVKNEGAYAGFEHKVDQAIKRDIIVGTKL